MKEKDLDNALREFCEGNPELIFSFSQAIHIAFRSGWLASKIKQKRTRVKKKIKC